MSNSTIIVGTVKQKEPPEYSYEYHEFGIFNPNSKEDVLNWQMLQHENKPVIVVCITPSPFDTFEEVAEEAKNAVLSCRGMEWTKTLPDKPTNPIDLLEMSICRKERGTNDEIQTGLPDRKDG